MAQIIIATVALGLLILLAGMSGLVWGPSIQKAQVDAEANSYLNDSVQISKAVQNYIQDKGRLPDGTDTGGDAMSDLVAGEYLKSGPSAPQGWLISALSQAVVRPITGSDAHAMQVCVSARVHANVGPAGPYLCTGADAPGGVLASNDPCCLA